MRLDVRSEEDASSLKQVWRVDTGLDPRISKTLNDLLEMLHSRFQIDHTTIQIERSISEADCGQAKEGTL